MRAAVSVSVVGEGWLGDENSSSIEVAPSPCLKRVDAGSFDLRESFGPSAASADLSVCLDDEALDLVAGGRAETRTEQYTWGGRQYEKTITDHYNDSTGALEKTVETRPGSWWSDQTVTDHTKGGAQDVTYATGAQGTTSDGSLSGGVNGSWTNHYSGDGTYTGSNASVDGNLRVNTDALKLDANARIDGGLTAGPDGLHARVDGAADVQGQAHLGVADVSFQGQAQGNATLDVQQDGIRAQAQGQAQGDIYADLGNGNGVGLHGEVAGNVNGSIDEHGIRGGFEGSTKVDGRADINGETYQGNLFQGQTQGQGEISDQHIGGSWSESFSALGGRVRGEGHVQGDYNPETGEGSVGAGGSVQADVGRFGHVQAGADLTAKFDENGFQRADLEGNVSGHGPGGTSFDANGRVGIDNQGNGDFEGSANAQGFGHSIEGSTRGNFDLDGNVSGTYQGSINGGAGGSVEGSFGNQEQQQDQQPQEQPQQEQPQQEQPQQEQPQQEEQPAPEPQQEEAPAEA